MNIKEPILIRASSLAGLFECPAPMGSPKHPRTTDAFQRFRTARNRRPHQHGAV